MSTSSRKLHAELKAIYSRYQQLTQAMLKLKDMAPGTVTIVHSKCGKPNCHCASGKGHPHTVVLYRGVDGKRHCDHVRKNDAKKMLQAGDRYRFFKTGLQQLRAMHKQELQILMAILKSKTIDYE